MYSHTQRCEILAEVHARPFQNLPAPLSLRHIAVLYEGLDCAAAERQVLARMRTLGFENALYTLTLYRFDSLKPPEMPQGRLELLPDALLPGNRQLRLQAKLEGILVIVVAYYLYVLVDLPLKNLLLEGELLRLLLTTTTLSLPVIMLLVYVIVRRLLRGVHEE